MLQFAFKGKENEAIWFWCECWFNLWEEQTLELKLSYKKKDVPLKKMEKTTFPFALISDLYLERNYDDIVKESTRHNVGPILVDKSFEKT